jgi:hypothetical protein
LFGVPIAGKSKSGKRVTLSSTEAEYFAISEVAKEILFVKQILESMGAKIEYPIQIKVDNVGAMFLCNTFSTSQGTKHIEIRLFLLEDIMKMIL